ncbi:hypothetical protein CROQUDRAFT_90481 [Cronartium quercuum f. sp. fusiforme G11]|uniref:Uncharacterized protein n=1 Tax=Cronartium quercuum f. sp. fusiforme G11 TaxID=708437 RepID=A0A9P6TE06_9BASI|nr:hypothetical protein CROQUDRAFT_90481 [Cronartium quercuum f. sp. fusiforme G11]
MAIEFDPTKLVRRSTLSILPPSSPSQTRLGTQRLTLSPREIRVKTGEAMPDNPSLLAQAPLEWHVGGLPRGARQNEDTVNVYMEKSFREEVGEQSLRNATKSTSKNSQWYGANRRAIRAKTSKLGGNAYEGLFQEDSFEECSYTCVRALAQENCAIGHTAPWCGSNCLILLVGLIHSSFQLK